MIPCKVNYNGAVQSIWPDRRGIPEEKQ